ncbi:hypothetical protein [Kitasatospora cheerisanensis]
MLELRRPTGAPGTAGGDHGQPAVARTVRLGRTARLFRHHLVAEPPRHDFTEAR